MATRDPQRSSATAQERGSTPNASRLADSRALALLFSIVEDAVVITDPDGHFIDCNPAAEQLFAYTHGTRLRCPTMASTPIIDPTIDLVTRRAALRDGRWEGEIPFTRPDGQPGLLHTIRAASRGDTSSGTTVVAVYRDITEHRSAQEALAESEKRLRFALEGANEGLWDWSIDTGDVYFSAAAEHMLG